MARIRSLKPEAFQSETLSEVSVNAERTFFGLSTQVDDRGRIADKPVVLNAALWAVRSEREPHTAKDLDSELEQLVAVGLVCRYVGCDGKRYLHLVSWDDHQKVDKASRSRVPRCPHHLSDRDDCGKHEKAPCPPVESHEPSEPLASPREDSPNSREDSRGLELHEKGQKLPGVVAGAPAETGEQPTEPVNQQGSDLSGSELDEHQPSRALASPREPSTLDLGPRTLDLGSFPPSAGTAAPRRDSSKPINAGDVIAAYMDGAKAAGLPAPAETLRGRIGKQARALLGDKNTDHEALLSAAKNAGAAGWNDLAVQIQRDAAAKKAQTSNGNGSNFANGTGARAHTPTAEELAKKKVNL